MPNFIEIEETYCGRTDVLTCLCRKRSDKWIDGVVTSTSDI